MSFFLLFIFNQFYDKGIKARKMLRKKKRLVLLPTLLLKFEKIPGVDRWGFLIYPGGAPGPSVFIFLGRTGKSPHGEAFYPGHM